MSTKILITGSSGLIGRSLRNELLSQGVLVRGFDIRGHGDDENDVRDRCAVANKVAQCDGVIHLAALSRVVESERNPDRCWETNVGGLRNVLEAIENQPEPPWLISASSREVYGQSITERVSEDHPLRPVNVYGRSKAEGERLVEQAKKRGIPAAVTRFSNVYGSHHDHADRVIPAFIRAALTGRPLLVEGSSQSFDFTHLDDTIRAILALVHRLQSGRSDLPPLHFVTGTSTTLGQLARLIVKLTDSDSAIREAPPRTFDVSKFVGCPKKASRLLGWSAQIPLHTGLTRLIRDFRTSEDLPSLAQMSHT